MIFQSTYLKFIFLAKKNSKILYLFNFYNFILSHNNKKNIYINEYLYRISHKVSISNTMNLLEVLLLFIYVPRI